MPQLQRCGNCSYPCPMCTPAYHERFGKGEKQTKLAETLERLKLPFKGRVEIVNGDQQGIFEFKF